MWESKGISVCPKAPFSRDPRGLESSTLTRLERRWAGLHMLLLLILECVFKHIVWPWCVEIFRGNCYLLCQIFFGLEDGQDTKGFSNIGVSLGCSYYFYITLCSQITSVGDLWHVGTSKFISKTNHWTGTCVIQFLPEETVIHY